MSKTVRKRCHSCICYCDKQQLLNLLATNLSIIERYALCYHDKDLNADGTPKEPHTHLVVRFTQPRSLLNVREMFTILDDSNNVIANCLDSFTMNETLSLQYLVHKNNLEKYQYDVSEVTSYNIDYLDVLEQNVSSGDSLTNAVFDVLNGVSFMECVNKYGRDYIINHDKIKRLADDIKEQEQMRELAKKIDIETGEII